MDFNLSFALRNPFMKWRDKPMKDLVMKSWKHSTNWSSEFQLSWLGLKELLGFGLEIRGPHCDHAGFTVDFVVLGLLVCWTTYNINHAED